jgi:DNA-binding NarL/FixJ family response regulator
MTIDIAGIGARLAMLIGEQPIKLETEAELLEYVGYVNAIASGLSGGSPFPAAQEEIRNGMSAGGWLRSLAQSVRKGQEEKREKQLDRLAERSAQQVKAQKQKGAETRAIVAREQRLLADTPEREQASLIARRHKIPERTVRHHIRRIKKKDQ